MTPTSSAGRVAEHLADFLREAVTWAPVVHLRSGVPAGGPWTSGANGEHTWEAVEVEHEIGLVAFDVEGGTPQRPLAGGLGAPWEHATDLWLVPHVPASKPELLSDYVGRLADLFIVPGSAPREWTLPAVTDPNPLPALSVWVDHVGETHEGEGDSTYHVLRVVVDVRWQEIN
jgi:hypothetical protein